MAKGRSAGGMTESGGGDYDLDGIPTKDELLAYLGKFDQPIRDAIVRDVASGYWPEEAAVIALSREEWDRSYSDSFSGSNEEALGQYEWNDELNCPLPTLKGLQNHAVNQGIAPADAGPDPATVVDEIATTANSKSSQLIDDLGTAYADALADVDLHALARTAEGCAKLYEALKTLTDDHMNTTIADMEDLVDTWEGDDADQYEIQYGNVGIAVSNHAVMAKNLHEAADFDFSTQAGLHGSLADALKNAAERIDELSSTSVFGDEGIKTIAATGIAVSALGWLASGAAAVGIVVVSVGLGIAGYKGIEYTIDPQIDTIPDRGSVEEVVQDLINGAYHAHSDAKKERESFKSNFRIDYTADSQLVGRPELVPGEGYYQ